MDKEDIFIAVFLGIPVLLALIGIIWGQITNPDFKRKEFHRIYNSCIADNRNSHEFCRQYADDYNIYSSNDD